MNGKTQLAYAPEFRQQIVELYACGRGPGQVAKDFSCSEASVHAWVKKSGTRRSLPDAGSPLKKPHRQAHQVQAAMALSGSERDELLRLRKENRRLQTDRDILANRPHGIPRRLRLETISAGVSAKVCANLIQIPVPVDAKTRL